MALIVSLTPRAAADLDQLRGYLVARNPQGADSIRAAIDATLSILSEFPRAGHARPDLEVNVVGVPRYSYSIYYRIEPGEIVVVHIRDDRRQPLKPGDV